MPQSSARYAGLTRSSGGAALTVRSTWTKATSRMHMSVALGLGWLRKMEWPLTGPQVSGLKEDINAGGNALNYFNVACEFALTYPWRDADSNRLHRM
jgi:hypothetical protein